MKSFKEWLVENSTTTADVAVYSRPFGGLESSDKKKKKMDVDARRDSGFQYPTYAMMKKQ